MKKDWIGVLDCNNFFVSCERLFRPDLLSKPVVVLSSNDGCVVARSQEVKDMGVPMGVPYFKIKDTLKKHGTTTFSSHFALYRDVSRRVFAVMREELDIIEQYSIDEAFFKLKDGPEQTAERLKTIVEKQVGIPVSIGLAHSKTQAKYANLLAKKGNGVCVLNHENWLKMTPSIVLSKLWGVGGQLEMRYKKHGLTTVAQLLAVDNSTLLNLFGVNGVRLQKELAGQPAVDLYPAVEAQKSIMSSRSFRENTTDMAVLADALAYHVRHATADLRSMGRQAKVIRVAIRPSRYGDFFLRGGSLEAILPAPTNDSIELLKVAKSLLEQLFEVDVPYQKIGIVLSQLVSAEVEQKSLFTDKNHSADLMPIIDALNIKQGREVVLLGSRLKGKQWQARLESCSPAYTTRWSDLAMVKA